MQNRGRGRMMSQRTFSKPKNRKYITKRLFDYLFKFFYLYWIFIVIILAKNMIKYDYVIYIIFLLICLTSISIFIYPTSNLSTKYGSRTHIPVRLLHTKNLQQEGFLP